VWGAWVALTMSAAFMPGMVRAQMQHPYLLRDPSISATHIAFAYAGNIWIADRDGGDLRRLTAGGHEAKPALSPDGSQIAFVGEYDGPRSVYLIPVAGGEPRRLTFHPADLGEKRMTRTGDAVGWTPDGQRVLFSSRRAAFASGVIQLFTVPVEGGFATRLPLARATQAALSPDGASIAYVRNIQWQPEWKHYRGGQTTAIWIANLGDPAGPLSIPRDNSNDFNPMWVGDSVYFLSDRNGAVTLFSYDTKSRQVKQVLDNAGLDLKSAAAARDAIIYEQFGSLHLLDLKSGTNRILDIRPTADLPEVRSHFQNVADLA
jgi:tricorn protease